MLNQVFTHYHQSFSAKLIVIPVNVAKSELGPVGGVVAGVPVLPEALNDKLLIVEREDSSPVAGKLVNDEVPDISTLFTQRLYVCGGRE